MPGSNVGQSGRYATIAAVVGLSRRDDSTQDEKEEDFLQRMMRPGGSNEENFIQPTKSKVRLVGVGRAVIRDYFYKVPSQLSDGSGEEYDEEEIIDWERIDFYDHGEEDYDDEYKDKTPIVMAEFTSLIDTGISPVNEDDLGSKKSRSAMSSEVHAIAELNRWVMRVNWMHNDRRKLVAGLNAAKARLNLSERRKKRGVEEWEKTKNESTMADGGDISRSSSMNFHPLYEQNISIESYKEMLQKETKYGLLAVSKRQLEDELMSLLGPSFNSIDKETFNTLEAMLICTVKRMKELEEKWVNEEELKYIDDTETKWDGSKAVIEYDDFADYDGFGFIAGGSIGRAESMRGGIESDDEVEEVEGGVEGTMSVEELTRRYGNKHENNVDQSGSMHDGEVKHICAKMLTYGWHLKFSHSNCIITADIFNTITVSINSRRCTLFI